MMISRERMGVPQPTHMPADTSGDGSSEGVRPILEVEPSDDVLKEAADAHIRGEPPRIELEDANKKVIASMPYRKDLSELYLYPFRQNMTGEQLVTYRNSKRRGAAPLEPIVAPEVGDATATPDSQTGRVREPLPPPPRPNRQRSADSNDSAVPPNPNDSRSASVANTAARVRANAPRQDAQPAAGLDTVGHKMFEELRAMMAGLTGALSGINKNVETLSRETAQVAKNTAQRPAEQKDKRASESTKSEPKKPEPGTAKAWAEGDDTPDRSERLRAFERASAVRESLKMSKRELSESELTGYASVQAKLSESMRGWSMWKRIGLGAILLGAGALASTAASPFIAAMGFTGGAFFKWVLAWQTTAGALTGTAVGALTKSYLRKRNVKNAGLYGLIAGVLTGNAVMAADVLLPSGVQEAVAGMVPPTPITPVY